MSSTINCLFYYIVDYTKEGKLPIQLWYLLALPSLMEAITSILAQRCALKKVVEIKYSNNIAGHGCPGSGNSYAADESCGISSNPDLDSTAPSQEFLHA